MPDKKDKMRNAVLGAEQQIRPYIRKTLLEYSLPLSKHTQAEVYLKCENLQYTGTFKVRGAMNKLLSLTQEERARGVVAASTGNYAAAVAFCLSRLNSPGIVFVPENTSSTKLDNIRNYNVTLQFYGNDAVQTELHALEYARQHNMMYMSPYNDIQVIAGQGTIAIELTKQLEKVDVILVPVGGGGLIAGIASYIKSVSPHTKVIGCLPEHSPIMSESIKAGQIIEMPTLPTLSDATAGGIEPEAITFELCKELVDDYILVSETEIQNAIITLINTQHLLVEGASGVALAALFKQAQQFQGKNVVVILSGGNISLETLTAILKYR